MTSANKRNPYLFVSILALYKMALSTIQNLHVTGLVGGKNLFCVSNELCLLNYKADPPPPNNWRYLASYMHGKLHSFKNTFLNRLTLKSHSSPRCSELGRSFSVLIVQKRQQAFRELKDIALGCRIKCRTRIQENFFPPYNVECAYLIGLLWWSNASKTMHWKMPTLHQEKVVLSLKHLGFGDYV